jgi:hypothetical protein
MVPLTCLFACAAGAVIKARILFSSDTGSATLAG